MAYSMETDVFLNAFLRFTCRRGIPATVLSDNGSNFVGANREFKSLVEGLDQNQVLEKATNNKICWKFNPPGAPHWGGVFESLFARATRYVSYQNEVLPKRAINASGQSKISVRKKRHTSQGWKC